MTQKSILHSAETPHDVILVDKDVDGVSCDGGGGALGHPRVFYSFDGQNTVTCLYCARVFTKNIE